MEERALLTAVSSLYIGNVDALTQTSELGDWSFDKTTDTLTLINFDSADPIVAVGDLTIDVPGASNRAYIETDGDAIRVEGNLTYTGSGSLETIGSINVSGAFNALQQNFKLLINNKKIDRLVDNYYELAAELTNATPADTADGVNISFEKYVVSEMKTTGNQTISLQNANGLKIENQTDGTTSLTIYGGTWKNGTTNLTSGTYALTSPSLPSDASYLRLVALERLYAVGGTLTINADGTATITGGKVVDNERVVCVTDNLTIIDPITVSEGNSYTFTLVSSGNWRIRRNSALLSEPLFYVGHVFDNVNNKSTSTVNQNAVLNLGAAAGMGTCTLTVDGGTVWTDIVARQYTADCIIAQSSLIYCAGTLNMYSGVTLQNNHNYNSSYDKDDSEASWLHDTVGGVYVAGVNPGNGSSNMCTPDSSKPTHRPDSTSRAVFNMYGGLIQNCYGIHGGAIGNYGKVVISGGEISNNVAVLEGGAIRSRGYVYMSDGLLAYNTCTKICNNLVDPIQATTGAKGGAIHNSECGYLMISGGEISQNDSKWMGGGIYVGGNGCATTILGDPNDPSCNPLISHNNALLGGGMAVNASIYVYGGMVEKNIAVTTVGGVEKEGHGYGLYVFAKATRISSTAYPAVLKLLPAIYLQGSSQIAASNQVYVNSMTYTASDKVVRNFVPFVVTGELTAVGVVSLLAASDASWEEMARDVGTINYAPIVKVNLDDDLATCTSEEIAFTKTIHSKFQIVSDANELMYGGDPDAVLYGAPDQTKAGVKKYGYDAQDSLVLIVGDDKDYFTARVGDIFFSTATDAFYYAGYYIRGQESVVNILHNQARDVGAYLPASFDVKMCSENDASQAANYESNFGAFQWQTSELLTLLGLTNFAALQTAFNDAGLTLSDGEVLNSTNVRLSYTKMKKLGVDYAVLAEQYAAWFETTSFIDQYGQWQENYSMFVRSTSLTDITSLTKTTETVGDSTTVTWAITGGIFSNYLEQFADGVAITDGQIVFVDGAVDSTRSYLNLENGKRIVIYRSFINDDPVSGTRAENVVSWSNVTLKLTDTVNSLIDAFDWIPTGDYTSVLDEDPYVASTYGGYSVTLDRVAAQSTSTYDVYSGVAFKGTYLTVTQNATDTSLIDKDLLEYNDVTLVITYDSATTGSMTITYPEKASSLAVSSIHSETATFDLSTGDFSFTDSYNIALVTISARGKFTFAALSEDSSKLIQTYAVDQLTIANYGMSATVPPNVRTSLETPISASVRIPKGKNASVYDVYEIEQFNLKVSVDRTTSSDSYTVQYRNLETNALLATETVKPGATTAGRLVDYSGTITIRVTVRCDFVASELIFTTEETGVQTRKVDLVGQKASVDATLYVNAVLNLAGNFTYGGCDADVSENEYGYLTFDGVFQRGLGGAAVKVLDGGSFTLEKNATIQNYRNIMSSSEAAGAVIVAEGGTATIDGGTIVDCSGYAAGAIYVDYGGNLVVEDGLITENHGAVSDDHGHTDRSVFTGAGAIYNNGGNVTINGGVISENISYNGAVVNCSTDAAIKLDTVKASTNSLDQIVLSTGETEEHLAFDTTDKTEVASVDVVNGALKISGGKTDLTDGSIDVYEGSVLFENGSFDMKSGDVYTDVSGTLTALNGDSNMICESTITKYNGYVVFTKLGGASTLQNIEIKSFTLTKDADVASGVAGSWFENASGTLQKSGVTLTLADNGAATDFEQIDGVSATFSTALTDGTTAITGAKIVFDNASDTVKLYDSNGDEIDLTGYAGTLTLTAGTIGNKTTWNGVTISNGTLEITDGVIAPSVSAASISAVMKNATIKYDGTSGSDLSYVITDNTSGVDLDQFRVNPTITFQNCNDSGNGNLKLCSVVKSIETGNYVRQNSNLAVGSALVLGVKSSDSSAVTFNVASGSANRGLVFTSGERMDAYVQNATLLRQDSGLSVNCSLASSSVTVGGLTFTNIELPNDVVNGTTDGTNDPDKCLKLIDFSGVLKKDVASIPLTITGGSCESLTFPAEGPYSSKSYGIVTYDAATMVFLEGATEATMTVGSDGTVVMQNAAGALATLRYNSTFSNFSGTLNRPYTNADGQTGVVIAGIEAGSNKFTFNAGKATAIPYETADFDISNGKITIENGNRIVETDAGYVINLSQVTSAVVLATHGVLYNSQVSAFPVEFFFDPTLTINEAYLATGNVTVENNVVSVKSDDGALALASCVMTPMNEAVIGVAGLENSKFKLLIDFKYEDVLSQNYNIKLTDLIGTLNYLDGTTASLTEGSVYTDIYGKVWIDGKIDGTRLASPLNYTTVESISLSSGTIVPAGTLTTLKGIDVDIENGAKLTIEEESALLEHHKRLAVTTNKDYAIEGDTITGRLVDYDAYLKNGSIVTVLAPQNGHIAMDIQLNGGRLVYPDGTFHLLNDADLTMTGGVIRDNVNNYAYIAEDTALDSIRGNIGVWQEGNFYLSGDALIDSDNIVYLANGYVVTVNDLLTANANSESNRLTIDSYSSQPATKLVRVILCERDEVEHGGYVVGVERGGKTFDVTDALGNVLSFNLIEGETVPAGETGIGVLLSGETVQVTFADGTSLTFGAADATDLSVVTLGDGTPSSILKNERVNLGTEASPIYVSVNTRTDETNVDYATSLMSPRMVEYYREGTIIQDEIASGMINTLVLGYYRVYYYSNYDGVANASDVVFPGEASVYYDIIYNENDEAPIYSAVVCGFSKENYYFLGWNTRRDGMGEWFYPYMNSTITVDGTQRLYGIWGNNIVNTLLDVDDGIYSPWLSLREALRRAAENESLRGSDLYDANMSHIVFETDPAKWEQSEDWKTTVEVDGVETTTYAFPVGTTIYLGSQTILYDATTQTYSVETFNQNGELPTVYGTIAVDAKQLWDLGVVLTIDGTYGYAKRSSDNTYANEGSRILTVKNTVTVDLDAATYITAPAIVFDDFSCSLTNSDDVLVQAAGNLTITRSDYSATFVVSLDGKYGGDGLSTLSLGTTFVSPLLNDLTIKQTVNTGNLIDGWTVVYSYDSTLDATTATFTFDNLESYSFLYYSGFDEGELAVGLGYLVIQNGESTGNGGAIMVGSGALGIENCRFYNNVSYMNGGAIANRGELKIAQSTISNTADKRTSIVNARYGGGVYNLGSLSITDSSILYMNVSINGGGVSNSSSSAAMGYMELTGCTISQNKALGDGDDSNPYDSGYGGGIANWGVALLNDVKISSNSAYENGGGVTNSYKLVAGVQSSMTLVNCDVSLNKAKNGAGIANGSLMYIDDGTVNYNVAGENGGGIYNTSYTTEFQKYKSSDVNGAGKLLIGLNADVGLRENEAGKLGGAIANVSLIVDALQIYQAGISMNTSYAGGGIASYTIEAIQKFYKDVRLVDNRGLEGTESYYEIPVPVSSSSALGNSLLIDDWVALQNGESCVLVVNDQSYPMSSGDSVTPSKLGLSVGNNVVSLYICGSDGSQVGPLPVVISVSSVLPEITVEDRSNAETPLTNYRFDLRSQEEIVSWTIRWGDGRSTSMTGANLLVDVQHYYSENGSFDVSIELIDAKGNVSLVYLETRTVDSYSVADLSEDLATANDVSLDLAIAAASVANDESFDVAVEQAASRVLAVASSQADVQEEETRSKSRFYETESDSFEFLLDDDFDWVDSTRQERSFRDESFEYERTTALIEEDVRFESSWKIATDDDKENDDDNETDDVFVDYLTVELN